MKQQEVRRYDAVGVGIGPFNLSLAALLQPHKEISSCFFDRAKEFQWHPGLLFPEATIQVSYLKDLVTLADPTSRYSFLSFLFSTRRLYRFITANLPRVSRVEFNQYLRWVCASLPNLEFGRPVDALACDDESLILRVGDETIRTRNVILGTGLAHYIPQCARPHIGATVFHASHYLMREIAPAGKRIVIVGGGQTGAEVVFNLLSNTGALPREILWISQRSNFLPLDESPFTNELFTPEYSDFFFRLGPEEKAFLLAEQKLASDGISPDLLGRLYRRLYEMSFLEGNGHVCRLYPGRELIALESSYGAWNLDMRNKFTGGVETLHGDIIILCTGFEYRLPEFLAPLSGQIRFGKDGFVLSKDYSIEWERSPSLRIYVQNGAKCSRGIADSNLSLMAWRSAVIINSLAGKCIYDVEEANSVFDWNSLGAAGTCG